MKLEKDAVTICGFVAIFMLLILIIAPPVLRVLFGSENMNGSDTLMVDVYEKMVCSKIENHTTYNLNRTITTIYKNNEVSKLTSLYEVAFVNQNSNYNNLSDYNALLNILDKEDNELLNDTDIVENDYKLQLKATYTDYEIKNEIEDIYNLNIVEDINKDEVIGNKDIQERLVEKILNEEEYNVIDATNVVLDNIEETSQDNLTTTFEYNNNIFLDEELTINYYIKIL